MAYSPIVKAQLVAQKAIESTGVSSFPVDVEMIARQLDVEIQYKPLDDETSGFLLVENNRAVAVINQNHHKNRQRFTIAHELGHFMLHVKPNEGSLFIDTKYPVHHRDKNSSTGKIQKEREANQFAACLLMPEALIDSEIEAGDVDLLSDQDCQKLADKIGVSSQALGYRLARLEYDVGII